MFLLDTNVLSAIMRSQPIPAVAAWIVGQPEESLFTASICQSEILAGIAVLPDGRRRTALAAAARAMFEEDFEGRVLPFDRPAAMAYAELFALRRRTGPPAAMADLMIAAIARAHGASVVTRDVGGFAGCDLPVIDPWATG